MNKKIKNNLVIVLITLMILLSTVSAQTVKDGDTEIKIDNVLETKKDDKKDTKEKEEKDLEVGEFPVYINYNNSTSVDLLTEKQLDTLYKYFADNVKLTYPTMDQANVLIFDQNNMYKMTKDLSEKLKQMDKGKEIIPNGINLLNTRPAESEYTTSVYCLVILATFAIFRIGIGYYIESKNRNELGIHK